MWVCLLEPSLPAMCGGGLGPGTSTLGQVNHTTPNSRNELLFQDMPCYTFNEAAGVFVFWGRNAELQLLSVAQMKKQKD